MKSTSSFRTQRHPPTPLRIPESVQFICLFINSLFAVVEPNRGDWSIDPCSGRLSFKSAVGGVGGGDSTLGQSQLWCNAVPSKTFGLCCQLCITYISSDIPFHWHCGDDGQHCNSNIQTCNWVVLKYSIHQSTFVYQVRNQRHVEVLFQFDRFSLLNFPIGKNNKKRAKIQI